jgi:hypothetical protein
MMHCQGNVAMKQLDKNNTDVAVSSVAKRQRIYQRTTRAHVVATLHGRSHAHIVGILHFVAIQPWRMEHKQTHSKHGTHRLGSPR